MSVPGLSILGVKRIVGFVLILHSINPSIIIIVIWHQNIKKNIKRGKLIYHGGKFCPGRKRGEINGGKFNEEQINIHNLDHHQN